jgi:hypothetical protein
LVIEYWVLVINWSLVIGYSDSVIFLPPLMPNVRVVISYEL